MPHRFPLVVRVQVRFDLAAGYVVIGCEEALQVLHTLRYRRCQSVDLRAVTGGEDDPYSHSIAQGLQGLLHLCWAYSHLVAQCQGSGLVVQAYGHNPHGYISWVDVGCSWSIWSKRSPASVWRPL